MYYAGNLPARQPLLLLCGLVELVEEIRLLLEPACPSTKELTDEQRIALMEKYQAIINQER